MICRGVVSFPLVARRASSYLLAHTRRFSSNLKFDAAGLTIPGEATFSHLWLRDSCQCPSCIHPSTSQKLNRSSDIPADIRPTPDGLTTTAKGVHIRWTDGHASFYEAAFLERYASPSARLKFHRDANQIHWDASSIAQAPNLYVPYAELAEPRRLLGAINQLTQYGLLFVTGVPNQHTANDTCEIRALASMFGELRPTFYGEVWDVKNVRNSRNIAYTDLDLGLHMDLQYFQHPPRYQILHCLRNRAAGGTSIYVDAFHAATLLRESHPADFDALTSTLVPFHYINDGHHLHCEHLTIQLDSHGESTSKQSTRIKRIYYSPPFQAPLMSSTPASFYSALKRFAALLDDTANRMEYTLREGDAVLFDNSRVLHARTAFMDRSDGGETRDGDVNRLLKGCYIEEDGILDRGRILRTKLDAMN